MYNKTIIIFLTTEVPYSVFNVSGQKPVDITNWTKIKMKDTMNNHDPIFNVINAAFFIYIVFYRGGNPTPGYFLGELFIFFLLKQSLKLYQFSSGASTSPYGPGTLSGHQSISAVPSLWMVTE